MLGCAVAGHMQVAQCRALLVGHKDAVIQSLVAASERLKSF